MMSPVARSSQHSYPGRALGLAGTAGAATPGSDASIREKLLLQNKPGTETILYVEDEAQLREVIAGLLGELGYHILPAGNGQEAVAAAASHAGEIHLLLTDVIMPDMDGLQLAAYLKDSRPQLKVLYVSGYSDSILESHGLAKPGPALLQKPFTVKVLSAKIREVLDHAAADS